MTFDGERNAAWDLLAQAHEAKCGACREGTLRLQELTVARYAVWFHEELTAHLRCDQCGIELAQVKRMEWSWSGPGSGKPSG